MVAELASRQHLKGSGREFYAGRNAGAAADQHARCVSVVRVHRAVARAHRNYVARA